MQHLIPVFLYLTYAQAYPQLQSPYTLYNPSSYFNDPQQYYVPSQQPDYYFQPTIQNLPKKINVNNYPVETYPLQVPNLPYYYNNEYYNKINSDPHYGPKPLRTSNSPKTNLYPSPEVYTFDLDYATNAPADAALPDLDQLTDAKSNSEEPSYYEDLELTENFANYLRRRTQVDTSSTSVNDPAHQYNALLAVLVALARAIRNTCADSDQVYDQIYLPTVETYYKYGLANADKVAALIEDYIRKGNAHIPKIRKLKQELCEKELFCSTVLDNKIKSTPLIYVKELETLESIAHLARSYYPYMDEFNQAAQQGTVLPYLQKNKERVKDYIMSAVNSVDHLSDKTVKC